MYILKFLSLYIVNKLLRVDYIVSTLSRLAPGRASSQSCHITECRLTSGNRQTLFQCSEEGFVLFRLCSRDDDSTDNFFIIIISYLIIKIIRHLRFIYEGFFFERREEVGESEYWKDLPCNTNIMCHLCE